MFELTKVLAATDGSDHGLSAVVTGARLAERANALFEVVSVLEVLLLPVGVDAGDYEDEFAEQQRARVAAQLERAGATGATLNLRRGLAPPAVIQELEDAGAHLLVVGAHEKPALARFLVGSTAERLIRLAHRPVLVATAQREGPFRRILAAVDLSSQSIPVLEAAAAIAQTDQAELCALYVEDRLTPMLLEAALFDEKEARHNVKTQFMRTVADVRLPSELVVSREIREGHAGREILHEADKFGADLLVLGSHGFGFFNRMLLGSTSTYVLRHGHRATLIVPRARGEAE